MDTELDILRRIQKRVDYVVTPVLTGSGAYSAGNAVGGLITMITSSTNKSPVGELDMSAILNDIVVIDKDNQKKALILYFFNDKPTVPVDQSAYAPTAADLLKLIGVVNVAAADYVMINSLGYAAGNNQKGLGLVFKPKSTQVPVDNAIYMTINTGASGTPTYASTSSLQIRLKFTYGS